MGLFHSKDDGYFADINWDKERYCSLCGHYQLKGNTCDKCLVTHNAWVDHDF